MKNDDAKVCRTNHLALEAVHVGDSDVLAHAQKKGLFAPVMKVAKNVKSFFHRFLFLSMVFGCYACLAINADGYAMLDIFTI